MLSHKDVLILKAFFFVIFNNEALFFPVCNLRIDPSLRKRYFSQGQRFEILMGVLSAIRDVQTSHLLVTKIKRCGTERK